MATQYKALEVKRNTGKCDPLVREFAKELSGVVNNTGFQGTIEALNFNHLKSNFKTALGHKLKASGYVCEKNPRIKSPETSENGLGADFLLEHKDMPGFRVALRISDSVKGQFFDFLSIWALIDKKQADAGIILGPTNFSYNLEVWDLFHEGSREKGKLLRYEPGMRNNLNRIGLLGFTQVEC